VRLMADYDFSKFPFDRQTLRIPLHGQLLRADDFTTVPSERRTGFAREFRVPEWSILGQSVALEQIASTNGRGGFEQIVMQIEIGRRVGYYIWSILLPLLAIVGVAWSTYWMRDAVGQRHRQSGTAILSIVAFQFVAAANLPRVSYLTWMDHVNLWTIVIIAATLWTNILALRRYRQDLEAGLRWDRRGRWGYPLVYVLGIAVISVMTLVR